MPDCQSGAAFPYAAAPVPVSLWMATNRISSGRLSRKVAAMLCTTWLAAVVRAPVSFQRKETGADWRSEAREVHRLPQWTDKSSRHPSLLGSDRASRRTLIALRENHHASGVALKVLATRADAVNDSDPCANFYTHSKRRSSVIAKACKKWRLSPLLSPRCRARPKEVVAGVATSIAIALRQAQLCR
jgi:hypothetical protein